MKRMMAIAMFLGVAGSMAAMAMTTTDNREDTVATRPGATLQVDDTQVQAQIDTRLHDLLVQMRVQRYGK
jgi:hypothetical protein